MGSIESTSGSDVSLRFEWKNSDGSAIDLSGYTVDVILASSSLNGKITAAIEDAELGYTSCLIEGTSPLSAGTYSFRVRITSSGGDSLASEPVSLVVT